MRFTQYLRPHGRKRLAEIDRAPEIELKALGLVNAGYELEIEELQDGTVSMTVEYPRPDPRRKDGPCAIVLCPNGPKVPAAVDRLIRMASRRVYPRPQ